MRASNHSDRHSKTEIPETEEFLRPGSVLFCNSDWRTVAWSHCWLTVLSNITQKQPGKQPQEGTGRCPATNRLLYRQYARVLGGGLSRYHSVEVINVVIPRDTRVLFENVVTAERARSDQHECSKAASACDNLEKVEPASQRESGTPKKAPE